MNEKDEILMIKQGRLEEIKKWAIPSGGHELNEETGYNVKITEKLFIKQGEQKDFEVEVHYFRVEIIGGRATIQDPDNLIYEIDWKSSHELDKLELSYPQDREMIQDFLKQVVRLNE